MGLQGLATLSHRYFKSLTFFSRLIKITIVPKTLLHPEKYLFFSKNIFFFKYFVSKVFNNHEKKAQILIIYFFYNNNKCELLETLDIKVIFMKKSSKLWSSTEREKK